MNERVFPPSNLTLITTRLEIRLGYSQFAIGGSEGIQDSLGFWIPYRGFQIPGTGFQSLSVELAFWIPIVNGIPDSLSCIPDSKAQDSRFHA